MNLTTRDAVIKVPAVTLGFWIIKIAATTLGETGGDAVSMTLQAGYAVASLIFVSIFIVAVTAQIVVRSYHPFLFWSVIVATTTTGTTMADFCDRSLGIGYAGGSTILALLLAASLGLWLWTTGSVSVNGITSPRAEAFYWVTVLFSQTLGTALGDWMADSAGLGYMKSALVFGAGLMVIVACYRFTKINPTALFWSAFVLTRPLGATLGDFLDKPVAHGGLALDRLGASALLAAFIVLAIVLVPARTEKA